jgi:hypothetical protein
MNYWYEIVGRYDTLGSKNLERKNDGTYSQSSVVILLIYLTFGEDHSYNIARFFREITYKPCGSDIGIPYSSNLKTEKVGTLLNAMKKDGLVTVREHKVKGKNVKSYSINPQIIRSPVRDGTYFNKKGSPFEIPLEIIEKYLPWRDSQQEEFRKILGRDGTFNSMIFPDKIDFFFFMKILLKKAQDLYLELRSDKEYYVEARSFEKQLEDYDCEIRDHYDEMEKRSKNLTQDYSNPFKMKKKATKSN